MRSVANSYRRHAIAILGKVAAGNQSMRGSHAKPPCEWAHMKTLLRTKGRKSFNLNHGIVSNSSLNCIVRAENQPPGPDSRICFCAGVGVFLQER